MRAATARCSGAARRRSPLLENVERRAQRCCCRFTRRVLSSTSTARGAARRGAGSRRWSSVSASEAAPVPVAAVPVVALLCRSQLSSTPHARRFYTSSRHDGADTRLMPARVHARTHAHAYGRRVIPPATRHARGTTPTRTYKTRAIDGHARTHSRTG